MEKSFESPTFKTIGAFGLAALAGGCRDAAVAGGAGTGDASVPDAAGTGSEIGAISVPEPACPADMILVAGNYCRQVSHLCLEGYDVVDAEVTRPDGTKTAVKRNVPVSCPNGCAPPQVCYRFVPGRAECAAADDGGPDERPLRFCIDAYEWPNRAGELPTVMHSWREAAALCAGAGKRLCGDDEWTLACEGPERRPYPYGWDRDPSACNIGHPWVQWRDDLFSSDPDKVRAEAERLSRLVPSGSMERCVSGHGVHDLTGNADEWVVNVTGRGRPFISALKGGHWVGGARNRCRPMTTAHAPDDVFYVFGFRCCADAE